MLSPSDLRTVVLAMAAACVVSGALISGCAEMPGRPPSGSQGSLAGGRVGMPMEVGVLIAGWHTGLVMPVSELGPLRPLALGIPRAKYLSFGWGNRRFYMGAHPGSGDALAALFRSPAVLFVQAAPSPADLEAGDLQIHWLCANRGELWRLDQYIEASLSRRGSPTDLGRGPLPQSHFYASRGHYSAIHTCNTWTAAALQYAGLPVSAGGVLLAGQVDGRIRELRACPAP